MAVEIPLFPLGTVLFPHMPLALHVFEERYRRMLQDCRNAGTSFGVVAIQEGSEVGRGAVPFRVGTLARIRHAQQLTGGRSQLLVVGASRFSIDSLSHAKPYLVGSIHYLQDVAASPDDAESLARALTVQFRRYLAGMVSATGTKDEEFEIPDEPELLSYTVAASLQVETARRQELLEINTTEDRLRNCMALLRREQAWLDQMLTGRRPTATMSLN
jgi:Lon protease-like protein